MKNLRPSLYHTLCNQFNQLPPSSQGSVVAKTIIIAALVGLGTAYVCGNTFALITFSVTVICLSKSALFFLNLNKHLRKVVEGNATPEEFISCVNSNIPARQITPLTKEEAENFLNRGGSLNIISEQKNQVTIHKNEQVITGCTSGINRSQVAAAVIKQMGIEVKGILAGGDSAMNPEANFRLCVSPLGNVAATNFKTAFSFSKLNQVGIENDYSDNVETGKEFYQKYIDQLSSTHFITFSSSGPSVLRRLLKRKGSLKGFTLTHFPWNDEIVHPPENSKLKSHSKETYLAFAEKIKACLKFETT